MSRLTILTERGEITRIWNRKISLMRLTHLRLKNPLHLFSEFTQLSKQFSVFFFFFFYMKMTRLRSRSFEREPLVRSGTRGRRFIYRDLLPVCRSLETWNVIKQRKERKNKRRNERTLSGKES